jgi:hypothetical protein
LSDSPLSLVPADATIAPSASQAAGDGLEPADDLAVTVAPAISAADASTAESDSDLVEATPSDAVPYLDGAGRGRAGATRGRDEV